jgi:hypothetical protein
MNSPLLAAHRFEMPRELAEGCYAALRERGQEGDELFIALSAVLEDNSVVNFRRGLLPDQQCHHTPQGLLVTIPGEAIFALNRDCYEHGEFLAAQIHAHPGEAYHSGADDALALVRLPGSLSIVVPDFARGPLRQRRWSIYQCDVEGIWRPLTPEIELVVR